jgi:hypothetical protein
MMPISRRSALRTLGALTAPALIDRTDAEVTPEIVSFAPDLEPLVSLMERTPREKCAEMLVAQLRQGVSYRQLMAALFLAGIRNINPRPPGFALHCVFVIHAAHLISLEAPPDSRLLPLFYAMDTFKASQERDARQTGGDFVLRKLSGPLALPQTAAGEFASAMDAWDMERAQRAVVSLARSRNAAEAIELLWRYGARDYRNIGHKAIFVANADRTLRVIGWQHAEPVLRSLVLGLLDFGRDQQVNGYAFADQCYAANLKRQKNFQKLNDGTWAAKPAELEVTRAVVKEIRTATPEEACSAVNERLIKGNAGAASIWDAVHLASAELRMRVSGGASIIGIHAVTASNALHHAYLTAADPAVRFLVLLQAVGWAGQFRTWAESRKDDIHPLSIVDMEPSPADLESESKIADIFTDLNSNPGASAPRVMRVARNVRARRAFLATATRLTLAKADEVHYYKYLAALTEDMELVTSDWQPHLVAALTYYTKGSSDPEPAWAKSARAALGGLA